MPLGQNEILLWAQLRDQYPADGNPFDTLTAIMRIQSECRLTGKAAADDVTLQFLWIRMKVQVRSMVDRQLGVTTGPLPNGHGKESAGDGS